MIIIDAQLPPGLAAWIVQTFQVESKAVRDLGLRDADDGQIFDEARRMNACVMTKDSDFVSLLDRLGPPPTVIWLTCGNTSNAHLQTILSKSLLEALRLIAHGEPLVEIRG